MHDHKALQRRLRKLLEAMAEPAGYVADTEFPYRPFPENEVWGADVACIGQNRYDSIVKWPEGSPELVIEVKSPSNTKAEMHDKAMTTLAGSGAVEFWIVDLDTRTVTVYAKGSGMCVYRGDTLVPVPLFSGCLCTVSDLFVGF
jgi:Uma2 family endonuclease